MRILTIFEVSICLIGLILSEVQVHVNWKKIKARFKKNKKSPALVVILGVNVVQGEHPKGWLMAVLRIFVLYFWLIIQLINNIYMLLGILTARWSTVLSNKTKESPTLWIFNTPCIVIKWSNIVINRSRFHLNGSHFEKKYQLFWWFNITKEILGSNYHEIHV